MKHITTYIGGYTYLILANIWYVSPQPEPYKYIVTGVWFLMSVITFSQTWFKNKNEDEL